MAGGVLLFCRPVCFTIYPGCFFGCTERTRSPWQTRLVCWEPKPSRTNRLRKPEADAASTVMSPLFLPLAAISHQYTVNSCLPVEVNPQKVKKKKKKTLFKQTLSNRLCAVRRVLIQTYSNIKGYMCVKNNNCTCLYSYHHQNNKSQNIKNIYSLYLYFPHIYTSLN